MQNTSAFWKSLAAADGTHVECRAIINNVEYTGIEPPVITRSTMQSGVEIGNVVSAICTFVLDTGNTVPKSAEVKIETRLVGGTDDEPVYSEWLPQGTFYISKRMFDQTTNTQSFECYDALLKANAVWEPASSTWPQQTEDILDELLTIIGLQLDSRTSIVSYAISKPNDGATIRDVLSIIAQHNGGNWIVTPDNKLRLVPIVDLNESDSADTIVDIDAVIGDYYTGEVKTISGVQFTVENETAIIGDETGVVVNVTIPGIIAGDVAEAIIGKTYRPFTFGSAFYDIAAELGDYIQCDDVVSVIYSEVVTLGASLHGDISAPDIAELDDEYPYVGASAKALQTAKTYAQIAAETAKNEAISAAAAQLASAVVNINSDIDDLQSQIDGNITTWFYAVDPTMSNPPAVDWDTDDEKNNHLGDLYYNTESGYCWRFMRSDDQYSWQRISDTDITTALANAQRAQATADNKRRVFVVQPIPPYDVGDLWVQGNSGDILRCTNAKATGEAYAAADWELASKYTDDSAVTALDNALNQQEVFKRLTDNGAVQGLVMVNGQLYVNATYLRGGVIDGDYVSAKLLNIVDGDGNVIASFDDTIKIGDNAKGHIEIDFNSMELYDTKNAAMFIVGDMRNANGIAECHASFTGNGNKKSFDLPLTIKTIIRVLIDNVSTQSYTFAYNYITFNTPPSDGSTIDIVYNTEDAYYRYDVGVRKTGSIVGLYSFVSGSNNEASGSYSHADGRNTIASGDYSSTEGSGTTASGIYSHAEGLYSKASGIESHAEGNRTTASGDCSHAEGDRTTAYIYSHAEGQSCKAIGDRCHAEGNNTTASGSGSHAEGDETTASGDCSHAEGLQTKATRMSSHAEGSQTTASGNGSHAEGERTTASGNYSHAEGCETTANHQSQHVFGEYNVLDTSSTQKGQYVEIVGNGNYFSRSNARTLDWDGNEWIAGALAVGDVPTTLQNLGIAPASMVTGVKGNAESAYRQGNVNLTPANIGAKATQSAVSSPTASGTAVAFIDTISQDAQGVITPTKKTVAGATQSAAGLMSAADKKKLDGIAEGAQVNSITGVKGNAESSYRTGNVNLTPANIGAAAQSITAQHVVTLGAYKHTTVNAWEDTGLVITVPTGHVYIGCITGNWSSGRPIGIGVSRGTPPGGIPEQINESDNGVFNAMVFLFPDTWKVFTKRATAGTAVNPYYFRYVDLG